MKSKASATAMSKEWLTDLGYIVGGTEQTIRIPSKTKPGQWEMFKRDLFNFADLTCVNASKPGTLYVQSTIGMNNKPERMQKILAIPAVLAVLKSGNQIELHVWRKLKGSGRVRWELARYTLKRLGDTDAMAWYDEQQALLLSELQAAAPLFSTSTIGQQVVEDF